MREVTILILVVALPIAAIDFAIRKFDVDARGYPMSLYREPPAGGSLVKSENPEVNQSQTSVAEIRDQDKIHDADASAD